MYFIVGNTFSVTKGKLKHFPNMTFFVTSCLFQVILTTDLENQCFTLQFEVFWNIKQGIFFILEFNSVGLLELIKGSIVKNEFEYLNLKLTIELLCQMCG